MKMFQAKKWLSTGYGLGVVVVCALLMAAGVNGVFNNVTASGTINSVGGYKFNGAAGSAGQALCSNGTVFNTPCSVAGSGITALTGPVTASGSGSVASTITATGVTAGSYTNGNFTVNAAGQLTAASNGAGSSRTCNANGCYVQLADGTIHAWGISSLVAGTPNSTVLTITYPITFTSAPNPAVTPVAAPAGGGGPCSGFSCPVTCNAIRTSLSTTGASVGMSWATVNASGYANLSAGDYCAWTADGN